MVARAFLRLSLCQVIAYCVLSILVGFNFTSCNSYGSRELGSVSVLLRDLSTLISITLEVSKGSRWSVRRCKKKMCQASTKDGQLISMQYQSDHHPRDDAGVQENTVR
jgi:hypothetical protein